jgi:hypothetical protein
MKFKDVAHHYLGCDVVAPKSIHSTFVAKLVASNNTTSFTNGIPLDCVISGQFSDVKPILKPIKNLTNDFFEEKYPIFSEMEKNAESISDSAKLLAVVFSQLCKDGYDLFGLIDLGEAIAAK